jgi:hypothetical protein
MFLLGGIGPAATAATFLLMGLSPGAEAPSSLAVKKVTFQKPATTTGVQEVTGVGFRGAALLIWTDRQAAAGVADQAQMCVGMTDGVVQVTRSIHHPDNEAATTSAQAERTDRLVYMTNATNGGTPTLQVEGAFISFTADGFRINWLTNDGTETLFHALVLGGLDAHLETVKITVNAGNSIAVTGVGFQPSAFVVLGGAADEFGTGDYNFGAPFGSIHGFGFSNAAQNMTGWTLGRGTAGASDTERGQHTDRVVSVRVANLTGAADLCSCQITAIGADGFTILRTVGATTHQPVQHVLCLRGAEFTMGSISTPASPGTASIAVSSTPRAVLLQTHGAASAEVDGMSLAVGAWQGGTEGGTWIGGADNANPSVYARATYVDATLKSYTPAATGAASVLECRATIASASATAVVVDFDTVPASPIEVLYLVIARSGAPTPGGELPEAIEPATSDLPTGILRVFALMTYGIGEVKSEIGVGETVLRDPASWYGGFKPAWLLDLGEFERSLSAQLKGVTATLTVADPGGLTFRALAETTRLIGAIWEIFVVSDEVRYALGEPHRRFAGRVERVRFTPGFRVEFDLVDVLSEDLGPTQDSSLVPPEQLTLEQFPGMTADYANRALQSALGEVSDESEATPVGVVPPRIVAPVINLTMFGGLNVPVVPSVLSHGALPPNGLWQGYYNTKTDPYTRIPIPPSAEGTILTWPGAAGWSFVGVPTDYVDFPLPLSELTRRYTPVFFRADHPLVQAWLNKEIQVAFNVFGLTEFANGGGRYWSDAPDIFEFMTRVFLVPPVWRVGDYPDIPTFFRGYSIVNHASIVKTRERLRAFGGGSYPVGRLLGGDGQQQTMRHVQGELCEDVMMEQGIDRHGRYMLDVEDPAAPADHQASDLHDIEDGSFEVVEDGEPFRTDATFRYGERYLPAVGPLPAPAEGETLPAANLGEHQNWTGIGSYTLDAAVEANDGKHTAPLELSYRWIRNSDVALNVTQRKVARLCGPGPGYNGARLAQMTTTWRRGALGVELGDVIAITHIEGTGTGGYVGRRFRVETIRDQLLARRITFAGRILPALEES